MWSFFMAKSTGQLCNSAWVQIMQKDADCMLMSAIIICEVQKGKYKQSAGLMYGPVYERLG